MKNNIIPTYRLGVQIRVICAIVGLLFAIGTPVFAADERKILIMGDSLMAWNRSTGRSVAKFLERELGSRVQDRSRVGASIISKTPLFSSAGLSIPLQFRAGRRDWIILNGGGNDLLFGCGCNACDDRMDQLAAADGSWGAIPNLLDRLSATGARVIYIGYLRSPGVGP